VSEPLVIVGCAGQGRDVHDVVDAINNRSDPTRGLTGRRLTG
jgi:hypothetical protein